MYSQIDIDRFPPLISAIVDQDQVAVRRLAADLDCLKVTENRHGHGVLYFACAVCNADILGILLDAGARIEDEVRDPLAEACYRGCLPCVERLVQAGARIDRVDAHGWFPLRHAVESGNEALVRYLVEQGADIDLSSDLGTALRHAVIVEDQPMIDLLLSLGATPLQEGV